MPSTTTSRSSDRKRDAARAMGRMPRAVGGQDQVGTMSSNSSKLGSTRSRTISKKHNGAYVVAREEGNVTRICWLHVVKGGPLKHFVAEPDRAREVFEAAIVDVATITEVATTTVFSPENWWIGSSLNRPGSIVHLLQMNS
jgi:hypothetical protein